MKTQLSDEENRPDDTPRPIDQGASHTAFAHGPGADGSKLSPALERPLSIPKSQENQKVPRKDFLGFLATFFGVLLPGVWACFLSLLIFGIFWVQNFPSLEGWYRAGRGLAYIRGDWRGIWPASGFELEGAFHPLADLAWGLAFWLGGGAFMLGFLVILQVALLVCLVLLGRAHWQMGGLLVGLALFLPGMNAPGALPGGYTLVAALALCGPPRNWAVAVLALMCWFFFAPFSWVLGAVLAADQKRPVALRIGSAVFALAALLLDFLALNIPIGPVFAALVDAVFVWDNLKIVYGLLLIFLLLGVSRFSRILSADRARQWDWLFGTARAVLVCLLFADAIFGWRVLFAGRAFAGHWGEHAAFAALARALPASAIPQFAAAKTSPSFVTASAWVHAHALIEPNLATMVLVEKAQMGSEKAANLASATIWIGSPSPRVAARELLESLESSRRHPAQISGTVALLQAGEKDDTETSAALALSPSIDPASEACLMLAWFEARRQANALNPRTQQARSSLRSILDLAQKRVVLAFSQAQNQSLAWAIKAEAGLIRFVLELEERAPPPFVESFRLAQVCHDLRKSLALDPLDARASNLLEDLLVKQNALDSAVEWGANKANRRLGRNAGYSLAEWRVLDLANELAFYRPLVEGKSMARLREANRLGLKGLALEEIATSDPVLFGPAGLKMRLELMFSLGYIAEAAALLAELKAARLDRDLGLLEWPHARGRGIASTWKFPAVAWWEAAAEAILDSPGSASPKLSSLIGELQSDRNQLSKRLKENFPLAAGALALPQHGWTPAGYIAWQQWDNESDLVLLGEQLGKQIQFLETLRKERQASRSSARNP